MWRLDDNQKLNLLTGEIVDTSKRKQGVYVKRLHMKIQFRLTAPNGVFWTKHLVPCGAEQEQIIPRSRFLSMHRKEQGSEYACCQRCVEICRSLKRDDIIEIVSTKEIIDWAEFEESYGVSKVRSFCVKNSLFLRRFLKKSWYDRNVR